MKKKEEEHLPLVWERRMELYEIEFQRITLFFLKCLFLLENKLNSNVVMEIFISHPFHSTSK